MAEDAGDSLRTLLDDMARTHGLLVGETGRARIYRDPVGGTVAWLPLDGARLELTLIQVRMADAARAEALHALLADSCERSPADIPSHQLGLPSADAVRHWDALQDRFLPAYLTAHREVQAAQRGPRSP